MHKREYIGNWMNAVQLLNIIKENEFKFLKKLIFKKKKRFHCHNIQSNFTSRT